MLDLTIRLNVAYMRPRETGHATLRGGGKVAQHTMMPGKIVRTLQSLLAML